jgi:hypothetical protein
MVRLHFSGRRIGPSECFTLVNLKLEENMQKNIFPKTRLYNQLIKQSNRFVKICKDINES